MLLPISQAAKRIGKTKDEIIKFALQGKLDLYKDVVRGSVYSFVEDWVGKEWTVCISDLMYRPVPQENIVALVVPPDSLDDVQELGIAHCSFFRHGLFKIKNGNPEKITTLKRNYVPGYLEELRGERLTADSLDKIAEGGVCCRPNIGDAENDSLIFIRSTRSERAHAEYALSGSVGVQSFLGAWNVLSGADRLSIQVVSSREYLGFENPHNKMSLSSYMRFCMNRKYYLLSVSFPRWPTRSKDIISAIHSHIRKGDWWSEPLQISEDTVAYRPRNGVLYKLGVYNDVPATSEIRRENRFCINSPENIKITKSCLLVYEPDLNALRIKIENKKHEDEKNMTAVASDSHPDYEEARRAALKWIEDVTGFDLACTGTESKIVEYATVAVLAWLATGVGESIDLKETKRLLMGIGLEKWPAEMLTTYIARRYRDVDSNDGRVRAHRESRSEKTWEKSSAKYVLEAWALFSSPSQKKSTEWAVKDWDCKVDAKMDEWGLARQSMAAVRKIIREESFFKI